MSEAQILPTDAEGVHGLRADGKLLTRLAPGVIAASDRIPDLDEASGRISSFQTDEGRRPGGPTTVELRERDPLHDLRRGDPGVYEISDDCPPRYVVSLGRGEKDQLYRWKGAAAVAYEAAFALAGGLDPDGTAAQSRKDNPERAVLDHQGYGGLQGFLGAAKLHQALEAAAQQPNLAVHGTAAEPYLRDRMTGEVLLRIAARGPKTAAVEILSARVRREADPGFGRSATVGYDLAASYVRTAARLAATTLEARNKGILLARRTAAVGRVPGDVEQEAVALMRQTFERDLARLQRPRLAGGEPSLDQTLAAHAALRERGRILGASLTRPELKDLSPAVRSAIAFWAHPERAEESVETTARRLAAALGTGARDEAR